MNGWVLASEDQLHNDGIQGESEAYAKANSKGSDDLKPRCRIDHHVRGGACCRGVIRLDNSRGTLDFTAGHTIFPAGKYTIRPAGSNTNGVIRITSEDDKASGVLLTSSAQSVQSRDETVVIFHRYGDQYFLFQVWAVGDTIGLEIPKSSMERQAARAIEVNKGQSARSGEPAEVIISAK